MPQLGTLLIETNKIYDRSSMSQADKDYELKVLKMAISHYFDESVPLTDRSIHTLETNPDAIVWDLATKIYRQSGHKVELSMVRDVVTSRIAPMKSLLAAEKERIAEENRRLAEEKARQQQFAAERARIAEEEARRQFIAYVKEMGIEIPDEITEERYSYMQEMFDDVFDRLKKVTIEQLEVDEDKVTPEANFMDDLGADEDDLLNLVISLEEEFDVELKVERFSTGGRWCDSRHTVVYDSSFDNFSFYVEMIDFCECNVDRIGGLIFARLYEHAK